MITRKEVKELIERFGCGGDVKLTERQFEILASAASKAQYVHIVKKADSDPLYQTGMDYLEEE